MHWADFWGSPTFLDPISPVLDVALLHPTDVLVSEMGLDSGFRRNDGRLNDFDTITKSRN
jgi:hypothetical protein